MLKNQKGFTLIELLIVIVIIGILAGVLIAIINPAQQQNRAKDAGVQATINKVGLAVEGFISAYGRAPNDVELMGSLQNAADVGASCAGGSAEMPHVCNFTVTGNDLKVDDGSNSACAASGWQGAGATACAYHYYGEAVGGTDETHFRLAARSYGIAGTVFLYDNKIGDIVECPAASVADADAADATDGDPCN